MSLPNARGFTLVEVMVATAITGVLIIIIMSFFINNIVNFTVTSARGDLLRNAQLSLDSITQEIRLSSNSYDTSSLPDVNEPAGGWVGDDDVLILGTAALDSDRNILFADELHYTSVKNNNIYFVSDNKLYKRSLAADVAENAKLTSCPEPVSSSSCPADAVLAENVASFTIRYFDGNELEVTPTDARSVELTLDLAISKYGRDIDASFTTRTVFRNE